MNLVKVLRFLGYQVDYPEGQTCCGLPALHYGYADDAKAAGEKLLGEFQGTSPAVTSSAACNSMVKDNYTDLFNNSMLHNNCKKTQKSFQDLLDFLLKQDIGEGVLNAKGTAYVWMDFCGEHTSRFDTIREKLFSRIKNLSIEKLDTAENSCCGFGGWFHVYEQTLAEQMAANIAQQLSRQQSQFLVSAEPGCMTYLNTYFKKQGLPYQSIHLADLLANCLPS